MPHAPLLTRAVRRTLDLLLVALIGFVIAMLAIARGLPLLTGGATFVVAGGSMEPTIPMGSVVHAEPVAEADLRAGDIVSMQVGLDRAVFTHRIEKVVTRPDGIYLQTKGDANAKKDASLVAASDVIGRVRVTVPYAGYGVAVMSTFQGVLFLVALAGMLLAGAWLLETVEDDHHESLRRRAREAVGAMAGDPAEPAGGAA